MACGHENQKLYGKPIKCATCWLEAEMAKAVPLANRPAQQIREAFMQYMAHTARPQAIAAINAGTLAREKWDEALVAIRFALTQDVAWWNALPRTGSSCEGPSPSAVLIAARRG